MNKIFLVNKESGYSSNQVVNIVKKKFNLKKAGHAGTLDPFASGLLIVLADEATKISNYILCQEKSYIAKLYLGKETDTLDLTGKVIKEKDVPDFSIDFLNSIEKKFTGKLKQTPPIYSAIKINGKCLYKEARKGKNIEVPSRDVEIFSLKILKFHDNILEFFCRCSKGTYIRSLGRDIAYYLGTVGYLISLERISSGKFDINESSKVADLSVDNGINMEDCIDLDKYTVNKDDAMDIMNGKKIKLPINSEKVMILNEDNLLLAIYSKDGSLYKCERGFNHDN